MQPYFFPYAGYYRLLAEADCFVILDSVQFPRRGRVHRCRVPGPGSTEEWLTLPMRKAPRDVRISDLEFAPDASDRLAWQLRHRPWMGHADTPLRRDLRALLADPGRDVTRFLEASLRLVVEALGLGCEILRSSALDLPEGRGAQDRIIGIVRQMGGTRYINAPGGRALYDAASFAAAGLDLRFLGDYGGGIFHMLPALFTLDPETIRQDILDNLCLSDAQGQPILKPSMS